MDENTDYLSDLIKFQNKYTNKANRFQRQNTRDLLAAVAAAVPTSPADDDADVEDPPVKSRQRSIFIP
jgi:hypothetical protein